MFDELNAFGHNRNSKGRTCAKRRQHCRGDGFAVADNGEGYGFLAGPPPGASRKPLRISGCLSASIERNAEHAVFKLLKLHAIELTAHD